jgi:hypothetical protein
MSACPHCGSRSIRLIMNPLTWPVHVFGNRLRTKCPRCGWRGWQHKSQWLHIAHAGVLAGGTGHSGRRTEHHSGDRSPHERSHAQLRPPSATVTAKPKAVELSESELAEIDNELQRSWLRTLEDPEAPRPPDSAGAVAPHDSAHHHHSRRGRSRHHRSRQRRARRARMWLVVAMLAALAVVAILVKPGCSARAAQPATARVPPAFLPDRAGGGGLACERVWPQAGRKAGTILLV